MTTTGYDAMVLGRAMMTGLVLVALAAFAVPVYAGPAIMSPAPVFDFGELDNEQKIEHDFIIKNVGDEPLTISDIKTSCGCTVAKPDTNTLQPGKETRIPATLNLKGRQGPQSTKITVMTNDPEQPTYVLEFKGVATAVISMEPKLLNMGRIMDNEPHATFLTLSSTKAGHSFTVTNVEAQEPAPFTASVEEVMPGKEYRIVATTNPNLASGSLNGRLTITTDDPERPTFNVAVYGHVIGELQVRPDNVTIRSSAAPDAVPATQYLQVIPGRTQEFELIDVIAPIDGMKVELIKRRDNDYHIKLSDMPVDNSLKGKELIVTTNLPEKPEIRIPFNVLPASPLEAGRTPSRVPVARPVARPPRPPQLPVSSN